MVLLVRSFVRSSLPPFITKNLGNTSQVLFNFLHEVRRSNGKKLIEPVFMKRSRKAQKVSKMIFLWFWRNSDPFICTLFIWIWNYKCSNFLSSNFLQKSHFWKKSCSWFMVRKPQDQSECTENLKTNHNAEFFSL